MKRICSVILAAAMTLSAVIPITASAASTSSFGLKAESIDGAPITIGSAPVVTPPVEDDNDGDSSSPVVSSGSLKFSTYEDNISIERDFEQIIPIVVENQGNEKVTFSLKVNNPYDDISVDFIKTGSRDYSMTLYSGGSDVLEMVVFAQDAEAGEYSVPFEAISSDNKTIAQGTIDFSCDTISFDDLLVEEVSTDPNSLAKTITITNNSDKTITGLSSSVSSEDIRVSTNPSLSSAKLYSGEQIEMVIYPSLADLYYGEISSADVTLKLEAGACSKEVEFSFTNDDEVHLITVGELALYQDDNPFAGMEYIEGSSVITLNGVTSNDPDFVDMPVYDMMGNTTIAFSKAFLLENGATVSVTNEIAKSVYTGDMATVPENGIIEETIEFDEEKGCCVVRSVAVVDASYFSNEEVVAFADFEQCYRIAVTMYIKSELGGVLPQSEEELYKMIDDKLQGSAHDKVLKILGNLSESAYTYDEILQMHNDIAGDIDMLKANLNDPNRSFGDKCFDIADVYMKHCCGDVEQGVYNAVKEKAQKIVKDVENLFESVANFFEDFANSIGGGGNGGSDGGSGNGGVDSGNIGWGESSFGIETNTNHSQCTNRGNSSVRYDYNRWTGWHVVRTATNNKKLYVSNVMSEEGYCDRKETNFTYYVNGQKAGESRSAGVTDLAFAELDTSLFNDGANTILIDYDTFPGHFFVSSDINIIETLNLADAIGYVGDDPTSLPSVRLSPDYAIYESNVYSTNYFYNAGENADFVFKVYNRGAVSGWTTITAKLDGKDVYSETVFIPAFSSVEKKISAVISNPRPLLSVSCVDANMMNCESETDNNKVSVRFSNPSEVRMTNWVNAKKVTSNATVTTSNRATLSSTITNCRNSSGIDLIKDFKIYVNSVDISDKIQSDEWYYGYDYSASAPLQDGLNNIRFELTYFISETQTKTIVEEAVVEKRAIPEYKVIFEDSEDVITDKYLMATVFGEKNDYSRRMNLANTDNVDYILTVNGDFVKTAVENKAYTVQVMCDNVVYEGSIVAFGSAFSDTVIMRKVPTCQVTINNLDEKVTLSHMILGDFRFSLSDTNVVDVPEGEYDYRVYGKVGELTYQVRGSITVSADMSLDVDFNLPSDEEVAMDSEISIEAVGFSSDANIIVTLYGAGYTIKPTLKDGKVSAPKGLLDVMISVEDGNTSFAYEFPEIDTSEPAEIKFGNELKGTIEDDYSDRTVYCGEEIEFVIYFITDQFNNPVYVENNSDEMIAAKVCFVNVNNANSIITVPVQTDSYSYIPCEIPLHMSGKYNIVIVFAGADIPVASKPTTGGSSSSYIPPEERTPKYNGEKKSWDEIEKLIRALPVGSDFKLELDEAYLVPSNVIDAIDDRDVKAEFEYDSARCWHIDGSKLEEAVKSDLTTIMIDPYGTSRLPGEEGIAFRLKGTDIPAQLVVSLGAEAANKFANVYLLNENGDYEFYEAVIVNADGKAALNVSEKGDYVVMTHELSARPGDVNNDGRTNTFDVAAILRDSVKLEAVANPAVYDFNGDGAANIFDASAILRMVVGMEY